VIVVQHVLILMVTGRFNMCDEDDWKGQRVVARWPRMGAMTQLGLVRIASRFSLARGGWAVEEENTALTATARGEEGEAHESEIRPTCVFSPKQRKWRTKDASTLSRRDFTGNSATTLSRMFGHFFKSPIIIEYKQIRINSYTSHTSLHPTHMMHKLEIITYTNINIGNFK
jgi:hypothetical protein